MVSLKYFEQKNCRISLLVKKELADKPFSYFKERKVATSYTNLTKEYLGIKEENIVKISGSVESAVLLGWADSIFDVVETGRSALENGLVEYKPFVKFGAILATQKIAKIQLFEDLGLIEKQEKGKIIAFDGLDGSGKSTLAKYVVQNPIMNTNSKVLITPYSGYIGKEAKALWDSGKYFEWATIIGKNHWKAPEYVNSIYDRSVLTFMTDLIKEGFSEEKILEVLKTWEPLPDILFYCDINPKIALSRIEKREEGKDEFDELKSLQEYYELYNKSVDFLEKHNLVKIVKLDTNRTIEEIIKDVEENLKIFSKK
jgi:thymidylate kinase